MAGGVAAARAALRGADLHVGNDLLVARENAGVEQGFDPEDRRGGVATTAGDEIGSR
ncbi:MAG: hypothetical protein J07HN4v3_02924 [Halonotius sp. J07HN4]|nr:MAG: hypothetical protein J07HN4v3_02924 [Halonotius sp. J07HN4]